MIWSRMLFSVLGATHTAHTVACLINVMGTKAASSCNVHF